MRGDVLAVVAFLAACGGKAVVDPEVDGAAGGAGGTGGTTATTTSAQTTGQTGVSSGQTAVSGVTATSTGGGSECVEVCTLLYQCGLQTDGGVQLCPGFTGTQSELDTFLYGGGGGGCVQTCEDNPALIALVDPDECAATIDTLSSVNASFAEICQNGF